MSASSTSRQVIGRRLSCPPRVRNQQTRSEAFRTRGEPSVSLSRRSMKSAEQPPPASDLKSSTSRSLLVGFREGFGGEPRSPASRLGSQQPLPAPEPSRRSPLFAHSAGVERHLFWCAWRLRIARAAKARLAGRYVAPYERAARPLAGGHPRGAGRRHARQRNG